MNYATICSGIGAPEVAFRGIGWNCLFQSEIDPFASAVLKHHWPDVPNYGDMTQWRKWPRRELDLVVAGTPCQAFSVAGKRGSLKDERGNLTLEFTRYCNSTRPRFILWENVPGVLNTKDNAFGCLLGALAGSSSVLRPYGGRWPNAGIVAGPWRYIAWRILDAQYFGLAQRRRRVFLLTNDLEWGDRNWACVRALFPQCESVRGDIAAGGAAGEDVAGTLGGGSGSRGWCDDLDRCGAIVSQDISYSLSASGGRHTGTDWSKSYVTHTLPADGFDASEDGTGRGSPLVFEPRYVRNGRGAPSEIAGVLKAESGRTGKGDGAPCVVQSAVRRLTPLEWERLQGFPDGHTAIEYKGKPASDSARYRAIGNSMAVPVIRWIGENLKGVACSTSES